MGAAGEPLTTKRPMTQSDKVVAALRLLGVGPGSVPRRRIPEAELKRRALAYLRTLPDSHWYATADRYARGVPDILGCWRGQFVAIELKARHGRLSRLQARWLTEAQRAGGETLVAWDIDEVRGRFRV